MPVTLTIKNVPEKVAAELRARAAAHRRSMQGELLALVEAVALQKPSAVEAAVSSVAEPLPVYGKPKPARRAAKKPSAASTAPERLTLEQLWRRAQRLGPASPSEAAAIVRGFRDARNGR